MPSENAIAANCRRLRAARGLSQVQLAEKVGLSRPGYLKVESGESIPRADTLERIAQAFNVSIAELVRPVERLEHVRFRSKKRINSREELLSEIKRRLDAYDALASELGEKRAPPKIPVPKDPKAAAVAVRAKLLRSSSPEKEPIRDICGLVESAGFRLLLVTLTSAFQEGTGGPDRAEGFFGLSVLDSTAPAIVVNNFARISVERRIFTVAHELGHLHLHHGAYTSDDSEERDQEEREADCFASYFLMPEDLFKSEWSGAYGLPFIERVLKVKRIFRVSYKTVLRRLEEGGEGKGLYPKFFGFYKRRYGRGLTQKEEPAPLADVDFKQDVLPSLVRKGVEADLLSQSKAAELLGMDLKEFRNVAAEWNDRA